VVFLINGIPVAVPETKAAEKPNGLAEGIDQIRRYHKETPEVFLATQVLEVTQLIDFDYAPTWSANRKNLFNWKDVENRKRCSGKQSRTRKAGRRLTSPALPVPPSRLLRPERPARRTGAAGRTRSPAARSGRAPG